MAGASSGEHRVELDCRSVLYSRGAKHYPLLGGSNLGGDHNPWVAEARVWYLKVLGLNNVPGRLGLQHKCQARLVYHFRRGF